MTGHDAIEVRCVAGRDVAPWLSQVAQLRISVFREFPYLYDGEHGYEQRYLSAYAQSPDSIFVLAFDEDRVVGASTGLPLSDDTAAFKQAFVDRGVDVATVFYFGESVLLPAYRGRGLGHRFFDEREAWARSLDRFTLTAFAAVDRAPDHPARPTGHRGNEDFWHKRGYIRQPGMTMHLGWKQIGCATESQHPLTFWIRALRPTPIALQADGGLATTCADGATENTATSARASLSE